VERVGQSKRDRAPDRERKGTHTLPRRYSAIPNCWTSASSEFFIHEQAAVDSLGMQKESSLAARIRQVRAPCIAALRWRASGSRAH